MRWFSCLAALHSNDTLHLYLFFWRVHVREIRVIPPMMATWQARFLPFGLALEEIQRTNPEHLVPKAHHLSRTYGFCFRFQSSSQATSHGIEEVSDATLSSPVLTSTPPPVVQINDPPSVKSQARDVFEKDGHPGARKRLSFENENADQLVSEDSQEIEELPGHPDQASTDMAQKSDETGKELPHEKKRSRGDHSLAQESG